MYGERNKEDRGKEGQSKDQQAPSPPYYINTTDRAAN